MKLAPLPASSEGRDLTVRGRNEIVIKDVLVGEVWLAAGQSNMASGIRQVPGDERAVSATATIKGNQVEVRSEKAPTPKFVRMGWHDTATPNLRDCNGWPVLPFAGREVE